MILFYFCTLPSVIESSESTAYEGFLDKNKLKAFLIKAMMLLCRFSYGKV